MSLTEWMSLEKLLMHTGTFILTNFNYLNRRVKYAYAFSKKKSTDWWIPKVMCYSIYIEYKLLKASLEIFQNTCIIFFTYRAHYAFVKDALDAFILGATLDVMELEDPSGSPQQWNPTILYIYSEEGQLSWLLSLVETIINKHINMQG